MGIEKDIADLIAAVRENTEALSAHTALLKGGIAAKKATAKAAAPADDEEPPKKAKAKEGKKAAKKALTLDDVKVAFGEYLSTDDKQLREERKGNVAAILAGFKVKQVRDLDEDMFEEALAMLKEYIDGEEAPSEDDAGDDEDGESLI